MIKKVRSWLGKHWFTLLCAGLATTILGSLYLFKLGSHIRGDSGYESILYLNINGLQGIAQHVSLAPIKFIELIMIKVDEPNSTLLRLVSVATVGLGLLFFYKVVSRWYTTRIALFTTFLLATSSYSLHLARFSNQDAIYYLVIPSLILIGTWLKSKKHVKRFVIALPIIALLLYIPGFFVYILLLGLLFRKRLLLAWGFISQRSKLISLSVSTLLLMPLIYSILRYPTQLAEYFGIDRVINSGWGNVWSHIYSIPNYLFYQGPPDSYRWLSGTPILDIASAIFFILGIYAYARGNNTLRARLLLTGLLISILIIGFSSLSSIALLTPLLYIVMANGLAYLMQSWFTVFPRNPAARNTATIIMCVMVALISSYHIQRYFIVWPNTPETREALRKSPQEVVQ